MICPIWDPTRYELTSSPVQTWVPFGSVSELKVEGHSGQEPGLQGWPDLGCVTLN